MDNETFASILDSISQGVFVFDDRREIMYCNQAFLDLTGFTRNEVAGALSSIIQGAVTDAGTIAAINDAIETRRSFAGEVQNYRKTGEAFWNELTFEPKFNDDGSLRHFLGTLRDVTQRKTAELRISKLKHDHEIMMGNVLSGVVLHKANTEIVYANPRALEIFGVSDDKAIGAVNSDPRWSFLREDGSQMPVDEYPVNRAVGEGRLLTGIVFGHRRLVDGQLIWLICNACPILDENGEVSEVLTSFTEITQLKEAEREARNYRQRFEIAAQATLDVIFEWDIETGAYWANEAFETIYGYPPPSHIQLDALEGISAVEADHELVRRVTLEA